MEWRLRTWPAASPVRPLQVDISQPGTNLQAREIENAPRGIRTPVAGVNQVLPGTTAFTSSFPSGHTLMAAIVYITLGAVLARMQPNRLLKTYFLLIAIFLTVLIGISRVYMGIHWPTDVLAGWVLGAVWALIFSLIARWLQNRGKIEPEVVPEE